MADTLPHVRIAQAIGLIASAFLAGMSYRSSFCFTTGSSSIPVRYVHAHIRCRGEHHNITTMHPVLPACSGSPLRPAMESTVQQGQSVSSANRNDKRRGVWVSRI